MPNKIILKKSSVASKVPVAGDLDYGELAINYTDSKLYFKKADGSIDAFVSGAASAPVTSVGGNIGDITDSQLLASIKNVDGSGSGLDADTLDGNHASAFYLASNPNGYTSNTGTVTSVGATAPLVSSGGTAPSISIPAANASTNGYMSSAYASKLDGIAAGATANTGTVTSVNGTGTVSGLTLSGTVTSSGSLTLGGTLSLTSGQVTSALGYTPYNSSNPNGYITSSALSSYLPLSGGTVSGVTTFQASSDYQIALNGNGTTWAGILWTDSGGSDYTWFNGATGTFAFGGGGSSVSGKRMHVDGGMTIGANYDSTSNPANGLNVEGAIQQAGNQVLHAGNYNSYSPTLTGGGASGTWSINITGNSGTVSGISPSQFFNNMGNNHGTITDFNSVGNFGVRYLQGGTNGPTGNGQWYGFTLGLGNDYSISQYGSQIYWSRKGQTSDNRYIYTRDLENGTWGSWVKMHAGYADSAGTITSQANSATITASTGVDGNNIVRRDGNGYIYANHINFNTSESENPTINSFITSNGDGWSRKSSLAHVKNQIRGVADGTWGISITGSAGSAPANGGTATALDSSNYINRTGSSGNLNTDFNNTPAGTSRYQGDDSNLTNSPGNTWWIYEHKRHSNSSNYWGTQIAWGWEDNANRLAQRNVSGGSWSGWVYYLNSGNYNNYSPTLTGGGASGTWSINVTGSAGSVAWGNVSSKPSNIMYYQSFTLDANTMDSNATGFTYSVNAPYTGPVARFSTGGGYDLWLNAPYSGGNALAFRTRNGDTATLNSWKYVLHDGNYNSYSPTLTGGGASGTWGINITGSAATFTSTTQNSQFNSIGIGTGASGTAGEIRATNNITAYFSSDIKFKENIIDIPNALIAISNIRGKLFDWKDEYIEARGGEDTYFVCKKDFGVIAQDVQKYFPRAVRTRSDGTLAVDYEKLSALALAGIAEQTAEIVELKSKLANLEKLVNKLIGN